jgi:hypothetical protein
MIRITEGLEYFRTNTRRLWITTTALGCYLADTG